MLKKVTYPGPGETDIHRLGHFAAGVPREVELSDEQTASLVRKGWAVTDLHRVRSARRPADAGEEKE